MSKKKTKSKKEDRLEVLKKMSVTEEPTEDFEEGEDIYDEAEAESEEKEDKYETVEVPLIDCTNCGTRKPMDEACPRCGLRPKTLWKTVVEEPLAPSQDEIYIVPKNDFPREPGMVYAWEMPHMAHVRESDGWQTVLDDKGQPKKWVNQDKSEEILLKTTKENYQRIQERTSRRGERLLGKRKTKVKRRRRIRR